MLRRLVLVGLMVLAQDSMLQLIMGTCLAAMFLLFQVQASPYRAVSDGFLASSSSFCLVVVMVLAAYEREVLTVMMILVGGSHACDFRCAAMHSRSMNSSGCPI